MARTAEVIVGEGVAWAVGRINLIYAKRGFAWDWRAFAADVLLLDPSQLAEDPGGAAAGLEPGERARLCRALSDRLAQVEARDRAARRGAPAYAAADGKLRASGE